MREDYVPNEKYRNMFGIERSGYGMEPVDVYLAQLEVAFKKIRADNRNLKREQSARESMGIAAAGIAPAMARLPENAAQQLAAQEQYIAQLQAQLAEQQHGYAEQQRRLADLTEQNHRLAAQLQEATTPARPDEQLLQQMEALRTEADELRRQLRRQVAGQYQETPRAAAADSDLRQDMIGKVLVGAQAQAEEIRRAAQLEADQSVFAAKQSADQALLAAKQTAEQTMQAANQQAEQAVQAASRQVDALCAEKERIHARLLEISYALRGVLRLSENGEIQRGEDFAEN